MFKHIKRRTFIANPVYILGFAPQIGSFMVTHLPWDRIRTKKSPTKQTEPKCINESSFWSLKKKQRSLPTNSTQTLQLCHSKPPRLPLVSQVSVPQVPPAARKKTKGIDRKTPKGPVISGGRLTHKNPFISEGLENDIDKKKSFIRFIWLNYV